jgi:hypothetical protein
MRLLEPIRPSQFFLGGTMILEIEDGDAFKILETLRLTPIYVFLHMEDSEERRKWVSEGFNPLKWWGYEDSHSQNSYDCSNVLFAAMEKALGKDTA